MAASTNKLASFNFFHLCFSVSTIFLSSDHLFQSRFILDKRRKTQKKIPDSIREIGERSLMIFIFIIVNGTESLPQTQIF